MWFQERGEGRHITNMKTLKIINFILIFILVIFIQDIWWFRFQPDFFLLFVVVSCIYFKSESGAAVSFMVGFIQDILFSLNFLNTLTKTVIAAIINLIKDKLILNEDSLAVVLTAIFSPLAVIFKAGLQYLIYRQNLIISVFLIEIFWVTLLNLVAAPAFIYLFKKSVLYE